MVDPPDDNSVAHLAGLADAAVDREEIVDASHASHNAAHEWHDANLDELAVYLDNLDDPDLVSINGVWYSRDDETIEGLPPDPPPDQDDIASARARVAHYRDPHAAANRLSKMTIWRPLTSAEAIASDLTSPADDSTPHHQARRE